MSDRGVRAVELLSQRAYARRRGVSQAAVWKAIQTGRISTVHGKIDPVTADREWADNTDPSKPRNSVTGEPGRRRPAGEPSSPMRLNGAGRASGGEDEERHRRTYATARAARETFLAQLARLELEERIGQLVRQDEVEIAAFNCAKKARDLLTGLPRQVSAAIAATSNPAEVHGILEEAIERVCLELSGGLPKQHPRDDQQGRADG